jgi:hypothetical protein
MGKKVCRKCGETKELNDFYVHARMADGYLNICKNCVKHRVKKHRRENDSVRDYDRWRYHNQLNRKERMAQNTKIYRQNNPEKYKAHTMVGNAVRDKKISKLPCQVCGDTKSHAHHEDYSKPLDVIWLCAKHHQRHHHEN